MSARPDFSRVRLHRGELAMLREAYAETYPVRPLINHVDDLARAAREAVDILTGRSMSISRRDEAIIVLNVALSALEET